MRKVPPFNRRIQLNLFCRRPLTPQWALLPTEVRHKAIPLLARLLNNHHLQTIADRRDKEAKDE